MCLHTKRCLCETNRLNVRSNNTRFFFIIFIYMFFVVRIHAAYVFAGCLWFGLRCSTRGEKESFDNKLLPICNNCARAQRADTPNSSSRLHYISNVIIMIRDDAFACLFEFVILLLLLLFLGLRFSVSELCFYFNGWDFIGTLIRL